MIDVAEMTVLVVATGFRDLSVVMLASTDHDRQEEAAANFIVDNEKFLTDRTHRQKSPSSLEAGFPCSRQ
jgi:hypothetical protein